MKNSLADSPDASHAAAGCYQCVDCGYLIHQHGGVALPACPQVDYVAHPSKAWRVVDRSEQSPRQYLTEHAGIDGCVLPAGH